MRLGSKRMQGRQILYLSVVLLVFYLLYLHIRIHQLEDQYGKAGRLCFTH